MLQAALITAMKKSLSSCCILFIGMLPLVAYAGKLYIPENVGHIAWLQIASILVIFMTIPGLTMFYSGLVSRKNALSIIAQCFVIVAIMTLLWVCIGYSLSFGNGGPLQLFIGGFKQSFLLNTHPLSTQQSVHTLMMVIFQMGFAIITPALITGSVAERMKFSALICFMISWEILVYYPICHWVWGGGWLQHFGMLDFAGGVVVHVNAGIAGLVAALMLGKRRGYLAGPIRPHNLTLVAIGAGILWIGWFGFNAGNASSFGRSAMAILVTQIAASAAIIVWLIMGWWRTKRASALSILFGAIAGLVAITPAAGYSGLLGAMIIGGITGLICPWFLTLKLRLAYDDSLDVFGIHGVGGIIGALLTGVFAAKLFGGTGLHLGYNIMQQCLVQMVGIVAVCLWSGIISFIILKIIQHTIGLRVSSEQEKSGLDIEEHGEQTYAM